MWIILFLQFSSVLCGLYHQVNILGLIHVVIICCIHINILIRSTQGTFLQSLFLIGLVVSEKIVTDDNDDEVKVMTIAHMVL